MLPLKTSLSCLTVLAYQPSLICKHFITHSVLFIFSVLRVKQTSLLNSRQYISAKQGLEFAETAIKTTRLTYISQKNKLDNAFRHYKLSKDDYDNQTNELKSQYEIDCAPWTIYVERLTRLIEQYSSSSPSKLQRNNKRTLNQTSSNQKPSTY